MPRARSGTVYQAGGRWYARIQVGEARTSVPLPERVSDAVEARGVLPRLAPIADEAGRLKVARQLAERLLERAAAADKAADLEAVQELLRRLAAGRYVPAAGPLPGGVVLFKDVAARWTSGELARLYPDHIKAKRSAETDVHRLKHILPVVGDVPMNEDARDHFELHHADQVMAALPRTNFGASSRRHVAQIIHRICGLSVFPLKLRKSNPIPEGWLPKPGPKLAKAYLYPDEDAQLMAATDIELAWRMFYGFQHREGPRRSESLSLQWSDIDLDRGALVLDKNKTDDPRAWALDRGVLWALRAWWYLRGGPGPDEHVFVDQAGHVLSTDHTADRYRADLERAGIERPQLFERSSARRRVTFHATRATMVTIHLANGKTEAWVADRTGHRSSDQIAKYRQAARGVAELGLGELQSLALAVPELARLLNGSSAVGSELSAETSAEVTRRWRNWQTHWIQVPAG
jgi:integrase